MQSCSSKVLVSVATIAVCAHQHVCAEDQLHLMDPERFDQVSMDRSLFGEQSRWLCDGMEVTLSLLQDGVPVSGTHTVHPPEPRWDLHVSNPQDLAGIVPATVILEVADGGAFVKGDTAGSALKPCTLENGVQLNVPPYVETGQRVVVDTRDGSFVKRLL